MEIAAVFQPWGQHGFEMVALSTDLVDAVLGADRGSWRDWWEDPPVEIISHDKSSGRKLSAALAPMPNMGMSLLAFRNECRSIIEPILAPYGEFLPTQSGVILYHCTRVCDYLDVSNCHGVMWGEAGVGSTLLWADRMAFSAEAEGVFMLPQINGHEIYLSRDVTAQLLAVPGLMTGTELRPVR